MKKATITVNFDEEKTAALKLYLMTGGTCHFDRRKGTSHDKRVTAEKKNVDF